MSKIYVGNLPFTADEAGDQTEDERTDHGVSLSSGCGIADCSAACDAMSRLTSRTTRERLPVVLPAQGPAGRVTG